MGKLKKNILKNKLKEKSIKFKFKAIFKEKNIFLDDNIH